MYFIDTYLLNLASVYCLFRALVGHTFNYQRDLRRHGRYPKQFINLEQGHVKDQITMDLSECVLPYFWLFPVVDFDSKC